MPEGPSIKITANQLRAALEHRRVDHFSSRFKKAAAEDWAARIVGRRVEAVRTHGKNLFLDFDSGWTLYSHMLMWGSWHVYAHGEEWRKEEKKSRVIIHTAEHVVVLFSAPVCELVPTAELASHRTATLGPDLLCDDFDAAEAWRRFQAPEARDLPLGEAVMIQDLIAGIGNILKCEVLFLAGLHPLRPAGSLSPDEFNLFLGLSGEAMRRSVEAGGFETVFLPPAIMAETRKFGYVYRRRTYPCFVCATPIEMVRQGNLRRMTWFCPQCQPLRGPALPVAERPGCVPDWMPAWQRGLAQQAREV
ncbi:MAG TPA: DNA-formamidopyrimidine glycosylase family protein [Herpetosiphonaceae bacterium]|nr:DNA-formamidopyrimidine glycosylase family protein [Herpetosiphonaceae bacterium]